MGYICSENRGMNMDFELCLHKNRSILMEGALGERLKREYNLKFDDEIAMASLVYDSKGKFALENLWTEYIRIAEKYALPFLATTPTRRANKKRIKNSIYNESVISDNVSFLRKIQQKHSIEMYIGGLMGCEGDAYKATDVLSAASAKEFHTWQADLFKKSGVDFLFAGIMPALTEAVGMAQAMSQTQLPYIISFMIRGNGRLIDGTTINAAIEQIDNSVKQKPICYMTNCVHPSVLHEALSQPFNQTKIVRDRFWGIQANTSPLSPEELDGCIDLRSSDAVLLAEDMMKLYVDNGIKIFGGCCGTDCSHMEEIARRLST